MTAQVWASKPICRAVQAYADFKVYRVGNVLIKQTEGTPIGGFLSSTLLHVHLAIAEHNFVKYKWPKIASEHDLHESLFAYVSPARYEDDLHCTSMSL
eukprot:6261222-Karenia_brevis.AAC.1